MDSQSSSPKPQSSNSMFFSNKKMLYAAVGIVIVVVVVALVWISLSGGKGSSSGTLASYDNMPVPASLMSKFSVSNNVSKAIGLGAAYPIGSQYSSIRVINNATPLMAAGKPEVLYIGADYCPFCAAQRWALIMALSRFGSFSGLQYMTSSPTDGDPNTATFTFSNASYSSPYVTFVAVETTKNKLVNGTYPLLQVPNASENTTFTTYNPNGSIPFVDFGNKTVEIGATYDPSILDGKNWSQIASQLNNTSSEEAQGIIGSANLLTAQICNMDGNQPQSVCGQLYIQSLEK